MQASLTEIAAAVQSQRQTALSITEKALARAERLQDAYRSFIALTPELARHAANRVDSLVRQGRILPLAGVPFAVKDLIDVQGVPTTCGSEAFGDRVADANATVVAKLLDAGAVSLGKTNMHECAFGFTGENAVFGDCRNPWDPRRISGGSSSGSAAAVASGICPIGLGSDTGGSIRLPAALCGLVGLKPTYGRVSCAGVVPLAVGLDHVGSLTRTVQEAAMVLGILAGADPADETASSRPVPDYSAQLAEPLDGLRIGVVTNRRFQEVQPEVARAVAAAVDRLASLGAVCVPVDLPDLELVARAHRTIITSEAANYHRPFLAERASRYGDRLLGLLEAGLLVSSVDYAEAQRVRESATEAWEETFQSVDCLVTPTAKAVAMRFNERAAELLPGPPQSLLDIHLGLTLPLNVTGHPAISVPCGFSADGLPVGMQIVGRPFEEATLLRLGHQYQEATDWHRQFPQDPASR